MKTGLSKIGRSAVILSTLCWLCASLPVNAVVETEPFSSPELEQRFRHLTEELRCPKCQNQNLADSGSPISADLRREIRVMLEQGRTDADITGYLVSRYGDFVLYKPPLQQNTLMLWLAPGVLVAIAALVLFAVIRRQRRGLVPGTSAESLSEQEQQQLSRLFSEPQNQGAETGSATNGTTRGGDSVESNLSGQQSGKKP